jgi:chromosome segregation ATPase
MAGLKKLKDSTIGLFWRKPESTPQDLAPESPLNIEPLNIPTAPIENLAAVDQEFFGAIQQELTKAMPVEFAEFYNQMSVINEKFSNLDEATRYQLAFHAAQTALKMRNRSLTLTSLIKSIATMEKALETEQREFQLQNEQGYQANLDNVKRKAEEMSQGIKDRENRLQSLQKEIDAFLAAKSAEKKKLEDERTQLISQRVIAESEINQLQQKKAERETKFNNALETHRQQLKEMKSDLADHLKNIN